MEEWTIKTPNPICRLFFQIDLLTEIAALCLTDFIDWRYIHSWFVFSTQLVNCCPHRRRNYTCVLLPLYLLSDLPRPPPQTKCTVYSDSVCGCGGGGCWIVLRTIFCRIFFTLCFLPNKMTSKHDIKGFVSLKFLRPCLGLMETLPWAESWRLSLVTVTMLFCPTLESPGQWRPFCNSSSVCRACNKININKFLCV